MPIATYFFLLITALFCLSCGASKDELRQIERERAEIPADLLESHFDSPTSSSSLSGAKDQETSEDASPATSSPNPSDAGDNSGAGVKKISYQQDSSIEQSSATMPRMRYEVDFLSVPGPVFDFIGEGLAGDQRGTWKKWNAQVQITGDDFETARIVIYIDMASVHAPPDSLTEHIKNEDFFDVPNFPRASFVSTSVKRLESKKDHFKVTGKLSVRGKDKILSFTSMITKTSKGVRTSANFVISRRDFSLYTPGKTEDKAGDDVRFEYDMMFTLLKPKAESSS